MIVIKCKFGGPDHEFPDDWRLGGANGLDPRADERWKPTTYQYYSDDVTIIHTTQTPMCDDQAIDEFTFVANMGPTMKPVWLSAKRPDGTIEMLPWVYDKATDTATER